MNSNELIIRIISIESPRQETAGQKNKYTIETEPSHYSCNLPVKVIFNLHLTHNFNNLILIALKWFNFQTCSTNPWDFQHKKSHYLGLLAWRLTMATHQWLTLSAHRKARLWNEKSVRSREANIAAKCEASKRNIAIWKWWIREV